MIRKVFIAVMSVVVTVGLLAAVEPNTAHAAIQATYYASPNGTGSTCSIALPCSLTGARDKVQTVNGNMTGDIVVILNSGTYVLNSPFQLTAVDSGSGGFSVIYKADDAGAAILSGGQAITGWTLHDATQNIYQAYVGTSFNTRQLYVNGTRATRAAGANNPAGFTKTSTGYTLPSSGLYSGMGSWGNLSDIEVYATTNWKDFRCPIGSISGNSVAMQTPCWTNAQLTSVNMGLPLRIENAYELLDAEGEWYLDRTAGYLYYKPRAGESVSTMQAVAATTEFLVDAQGTLNTPIHHIQFQGLTFAYSTWLRPSSSEGFAGAQAGYHRIDNDDYVKTPSALSFKTANNIRIEHSTFEHIGSSALEFWYGSQDNTINGNRFEDISGAAVHIGGVEVDDHHPSDSRMIVKNNTVSDNYITNVANEYRNNVAIFAGYTENTNITHNEIHDIAYSGISIGWGWGKVDVGGSDGYTTPTTAKDNKIQYNLIYRYVEDLFDAGGIYTLGAQPDSVISNNYLHNNFSQYAQIYLDQGTQYFTITQNVIDNSYSRWLFIQPNVQPYAINNTATHNYTDTSSKAVAAGNTVNTTTVVTNNSWPAAAKTIKNNAGLEAAYDDVKYGIAYGRPASESSQYGSTTGAANGNDGDAGTIWASGTSVAYPWWQVDLETAQAITKVELVARQDMDQSFARSNFEVRASNAADFSSYTVLGGQGTVAFPSKGTWTLPVADTTSFRYIRVVKTANEGFNFAEFRVFH